MPQRKVLQSVILHRETGRVVPTIGSIFDFTQAELESINRLNPNALGRPVQEVDLENQAAQDAARKAQEEQAAAEAAKAKQKGGNKGNKPSDDDEI